MLRKIEALPGEVSSVQSYLCLERC